MFMQQFHICFEITEVFWHFAQYLYCVINSTVIKIQNHALVAHICNLVKINWHKLKYFKIISDQKKLTVSSKVQCGKQWPLFLLFSAYSFFLIPLSFFLYSSCLLGSLQIFFLHFFTSFCVRSHFFSWTYSSPRQPFWIQAHGFCHPMIHCWIQALSFCHLKGIACLNWANFYFVSFHIYAINFQWKLLFYINMNTSLVNYVELHLQQLDC